MADPLYPNEYLFDPTLGIKLEPGMDALVTSASVPIPTRRMADPDFTYELNADPFNMSSPLMSNDNTLDMTYASDLNTWSRDIKVDAFRMDDEEDIFQVEKSDLIQGPTLAELNASEDQLLVGDLTFDGLLLPGDSSCFNLPAVTMLHVDTPCSALSPSTDSPSPLQSHLGITASFVPSSFPPAGIGFLKDNATSSSSAPLTTLDMYLPKPVTTLSPSSQQSVSPSHSSPRHSTLHELLMKREPVGRSVPAPSPPLRQIARPRPSSRLSSSAPTNLGMEQIWQRREPRQHLLSTGSLAEADSVSSLSTLGVLSPESHEFSLDDGSDSEDESDRLEIEASSDGDSSDGEGGRSTQPSSAKRERYFWQYNVQAKGPKGQRLVLKSKLEDPHVLNEVTDPVFSPSCSVRGIKHSGKARKGDGNDLTPNPKKLQVIGKELEKLNKIINDITPVSELPFNIRPKTRKEKNKLASRACRLKKKAQHEANKIKLYGLEHEHKRLMSGIHQMKQLIVAKVNSDPSAQEELTKQGEKLFKAASKIKIAGQSTEYVNRVLDRAKNGMPDGGLNEF